MRSSSRRHERRRDQSGGTLVEVLVASALIGVALVVLLGSISSLVLGTRVAERRTIEQRLARNEIETLMAMPFPPPGDCSSTRTKRTPRPIDGTTYTISTRTQCLASRGERPLLVEFTVTVVDPSGASLSLTEDRVWAGP